MDLIGPNELIVKIESVTVDRVPAFMLSLVPAVVNIGSLELLVEDGGLVYRDAKSKDWEGCRCKLVYPQELESVVVTRERFLK